jgi:hypothetical protein
MFATQGTVATSTLVFVFFDLTHSTGMRYVDQWAYALFWAAGRVSVKVVDAI